MLKLGKMIKFVVFLVCVAKITEAALARYPPEQKPEEFKNEEGCFLKELGYVLPVMAKVSPINNNQCVQYICQKDNGETVLESCGAVSAPNCTLTQDFSKPYPGCCKKASCPKPAPVETTPAPMPTPAPITAKTNSSAAQAQASGRQTSTSASASPGQAQAQASATA